MDTIETTTIRVLEVTTVGFTNPKVTTEVIWEGEDTKELSTIFPPSGIFGADLLGNSEIEGGFIRTHHRFERQCEDGSWEEIADPRQRMTARTETERAIEAENRRDFPGDYI